MHKKQLLALAGVAGVCGLLLSAPAANAVTTITIGLQEAGFNGGAITPFVTNNVNTAYGTFTTNIVAAAGPNAADLLGTTSLNTSSSTAGTLNVYVTLQGLTTPLGSALAFLSSFTENVLTNVSSVVESTYLSSANGLFTGTLLDTHSFTGIGTNQQVAVADTGGGPYSVTEVFTINATGASNTVTSTIDISTTPLPGALPLFGGGLGVLGLLARRKTRKSVAPSALA